MKFKKMEKRLLTRSRVLWSSKLSSKIRDWYRSSLSFFLTALSSSSWSWSSPNRPASNSWLLLFILSDFESLETTLIEETCLSRMTGLDSTSTSLLGSIDKARVSDGKYRSSLNSEDDDLCEIFRVLGLFE